MGVFGNKCTVTGYRYGILFGPPVLKYTACPFWVKLPRRSRTPPFVLDPYNLSSNTNNRRRYHVQRNYAINATVSLRNSCKQSTSRIILPIPFDGRYLTMAFVRIFSSLILHGELFRDFLICMYTKIIFLCS